jgi:hypothetical protein
MVESAPELQKSLKSRYMTMISLDEPAVAGPQAG